MVWRTVTAGFVFLPLVVFAACGGDDDSDPSTTSPAPPPSTQPEAYGAPQQIGGASALTLDAAALASMALTSEDFGQADDLILISEQSGPQPRNKIFTNDTCDPYVAAALDRVHWRGAYVQAYETEAGRSFRLEQSTPRAGEVLFVDSPLILLQDSSEAAVLVAGMSAEFQSEQQDRSSCGNTVFEKAENFDPASIGDGSDGWTQSMSISGTNMTQTWVFFHDGAIAGLAIVVRAGANQPAEDEADGLAQRLGERVASVLNPE